MTRERLTKPVTPLQRAPESAPKTRASSRPVQLARLPRSLEAKPVSPAHLEIQRAQALEVQRQADLEGQRAAIQRAHDDRSTQARAAQTVWQARGTKTLGVQRAVAEHTRSARDASHTRTAFVAQRSSEHLESLVAQRLEAEACPALPSVQRQADLTLSHVADHFGSKAAVQLARDPDRLSSYAGFKNAGAGLVKNFRTPGSSHTIPELASAIQRFRDPMQRAAVEGAVYAAFGSHPTYPKQLQRALETRDSQLEVQRTAWQRELEPVAQRQALEEASGEGAAGMIEAARGSGQPLPAGVRAMLEAKWNTDLSKVRVHTDSRSSQISKKLNAKALTTGQDIFFGASTFNPTSLEGLQLIAHEAWHTVQQAQGLVQAGVDRDKGLELEARGKGAELSSGDVQTASSAAATSSGGKESKTKRATRTASPASGTPSTTQTATRATRTSKTVQRSITPAPTSLKATTTRVTGNLEGLASSAPIFGTPVQRAADGTVIQRAWWNPFDWAVEGAKWLGASFMSGLEWMGEKAAKVFMEVFAAAAKPFGATGKLVLEAIRNIGKPLLSILENPGRFATNLIQGVKQGFMGFATNAPKHLTGVLGSFLGGKGLSLTFPTKLEPMPILMAFITTLDLGWDSIKAKIADQLGPKGHQALALAEKSVPIVKQLRGGLHNSSEFTKEVLPTLKTQAVDGVKTAAQEGLIRAGINALLKLIPGAGTVMAIFDTVRVLIERAKDISSLVQNVMGAFGAIAGGNVSSAAVAVEKSLVGGIGIALNFVAKLTNMTSFIERVRGIIGKVTTKISSVMKPLIRKAVGFIKPIANKLMGKTTNQNASQKGKTPESVAEAAKRPETKNSTQVRAAVEAEIKASLQSEVDPTKAKKIITDAYKKFSSKGLKAIEAVENKQLAGHFDLYLTASPRKKAFQFNVNQLLFKLPNGWPNSITVLLASLNNEKIGKFTSGNKRHAEAWLLDDLRKYWHSQYETQKKVEKGKITTLEIVITRSPCGNPEHMCARELTVFVDEMQAKGYPIKLNIRFISAYEGKNPQDKKASIDMLRDLREKGVGLSVITLQELIEENLIAGDIPDDEKGRELRKQINEKVAKAQKILGEV